MTYDAAIVGAGPAGYECALWIAKLGGKAAVVECGLAGGTCTNRGCIPTKALIASCDRIRQARDGKAHGIMIRDLDIDLAALFSRRDRVVKTMRMGVEKPCQIG